MALSAGTFLDPGKALVLALFRFIPPGKVSAVWEAAISVPAYICQAHVSPEIGGLRSYFRSSYPDDARRAHITVEGATSTRSCLKES